MTTFTNIPKHVEEVLEKSNVTTVAQELPQERRLLVVSFSAAGTDPSGSGSKRPRPPRLLRVRVRIPTPTSSNSIRGS